MKKPFTQPTGTRMNSTYSRPAATRLASGAASVGEPPKMLPNGFTNSESVLIHESLSLSGFQWFDGDKLIMGKKTELEVFFRPGQSESARWVVMGFPLYDMNAPSAAEVCLHFLAEAFGMTHMLDFQYQVAINMDTEKLEFLIQLPLENVTPSQLGELIRTFFDALAETILEDLSEILSQFESYSE